MTTIGCPRRWSIPLLGLTMACGCAGGGGEVDDSTSVRWVQVDSWDGSAGTSRTDSFRITTPEWRVITGGAIYESMPGAVGVEIHGPGDGVLFSQQTTQPGEDTTAVSLPPGLYFLEVEATVTWSVAVEERDTLSE